MNTYDKTILITGGAGFIGSNLCTYLVNKYPNYLVINYDNLSPATQCTYEYIKDLRFKENYRFVKADISKDINLKFIFSSNPPDVIINLASHTNIGGQPEDYVNTNINGTFKLLEACRSNWQTYDNKLFYQISCDDVYGGNAIDSEVVYNESSKYKPKSPQTATEAAADLLAMSYYYGYGMPVIVSNSCNNYGINQQFEKLIPSTILSLINKEKINIEEIVIRDWIDVNDHISAIDVIMHNGQIGETYCVSGSDIKSNIEIIRLVCKELQKFGHVDCDKLIDETNALDGLCMRYSVDSTKLKDIGWVKSDGLLEDKISDIIQWYINE